MRMATADDERLGTEAVYHMSTRLEAVWHDGRSAEARRADLFRMWDECNASRYGVEARATILGFIRRRLPRGSPDAYPPNELGRLNDRRTSAEQFDPYGR
jgi:hypothetical protein